MLLTLLSFALVTEGFSPSGFKYGIKRKSKKKPQYSDDRVLKDFLKEEFPDAFASLMSSPRNKHIDMMLPKTVAEMPRLERNNAAYLCLELNIPDEAIKTFFNLNPKVMNHLKTMILFKPLEKIAHKKEETKEDITVPLEKLTNDYFPVLQEENKNIPPVDVLMEPMDPLSSEEEKIQRATLLLSLASTRFLPCEEIAKITHLDVLKIQSLNIEDLKEKPLMATEEKVVLTEEKNPEQKELLEAEELCFFNDESDHYIKTLLEKNVPVEIIAAVRRTSSCKIAEFADIFDIKIKRINRTITLPKDKKYLLKTMEENDTLKNREKRAKELLIHSNISVKKISYITHLAHYHVWTLAKIWRGRTKKETYSIPENEKNLLKPMSERDPLAEREKRVKQLLPYEVPLTKIASITKISSFKIKKLAREWDIVIKDGKNKFELPESEAHLLIKMDKNIPIETRKQRVKELLLKKVPVSIIEETSGIYYKKIRKLAKEWDIPIRVHDKYRFFAK